MMKIYDTDISYDHVDTKNIDVHDTYQQWPLPWLLLSLVYL